MNEIKYTHTDSKNENLILSLIKDDLINVKLINGLNQVGLNADKYTLDLSDTIFSLMGFKDNEETEIIYKHYLELSKQATLIDISNSNKSMEVLARQIYNEILPRKSTTTNAL